MTHGDTSGNEGWRTLTAQCSFFPGRVGGHLSGVDEPAARLPYPAQRRPPLVGQEVAASLAVICISTL